MSLVSVKFIKGKPPYNANEIAGFSAHIAADLVRKKFAVLVNEGEIDIETKEVLAEIIAESSGEFQAVLEKTKAEIELIIVNKDDEGNFTLTDSDLARMVSEERNGKERKGVIKLIEDVIFERLKENT